MCRRELSLQCCIGSSHGDLIAQTITKYQVVSPERTVDEGEIEMMRAVMFKTTDQQLTLRHTPWAAMSISSGLESRDICTRLYSRLVTSHQIDNWLGFESRDCGATDVLKQKRWQSSIFNLLYKTCSFRPKRLNPCGIGRLQLYNATTQSD